MKERGALTARAKDPDLQYGVFLVKYCGPSSLEILNKARGK